MVYFPIPIALIMFMAVTGLLMVSFLLYQAYGISVGRTTYETLKRNQLLKDTAAAAAAAAKLQDSNLCNADAKYGDAHMQDVGEQRNGSSSSRQAASNGSAAAAAGSAADSAGSWRGKLLFWRRQQQQQQQLVNYYDRGFWGNWCEVIWPDAFLQQYRQQLAAHSKEE
jgi:hypothetical protein